MKIFKTNQEIKKLGKTIIFKKDITFAEALNQKYINDINWDQWNLTLKKYENDRQKMIDNELIYLLKTDDVIYPASSTFLNQNYVPKNNDEKEIWLNFLDLQIEGIEEAILNSKFATSTEEQLDLRKNNFQKLKIFIENNF